MYINIENFLREIGSKGIMIIAYKKIKLQKYFFYNFSKKYFLQSLKKK